MPFSRYSVREPVCLGWQNAVELMPGGPVKGFEVTARPAEELTEAVNALRGAGIEPMTVAGGVKLNEEESIASYVATLDTAQQLGIPIFFTSASGEEDQARAMGLLRELAEEAAKREIVISLETHLPYCENADRMLATMKAAGHSNLRVNFDTANIFYYNEGLDSADELERVVEYVASVHLKDTDGGFKSPQFPVLGQGVVQFERIFATLERAGFAGPLTLELEGPLMRGLEAPARHAAVLECMEYLRSIGVA